MERVPMPQIKRKPVVVQLTDGPCAGARATVLSHGHDLWQRLGPGVQVWVHYVKNLFKPGEYVYAGHARTTWEHGEAMHADQDNTYGESYGA
jgi:hypothetical protein